MGRASRFLTERAASLLPLFQPPSGSRGVEPPRPCQLSDGAPAEVVHGLRSVSDADGRASLLLSQELEGERLHLRIGRSAAGRSRVAAGVEYVEPRRVLAVRGGVYAL